MDGKFRKTHSPGHRFKGDAGRLRKAERIAILQPERVVTLSLRRAPVRTVLDVGTGTGLFAEVFSAAGADVTGVDVSADLLAAARKHVPSARFVEGTAETLPFEDDSFDLVFLGHVLHETDSPSRTLEEARRVARIRVVVLEWPYRTEELGPPLAHRLKAEEVETLAGKARLRLSERVDLPHAVLYLLVPERVAHD